MDSSQIPMHRHLYMAFVCVVLCTLMIFSAGCTGTDSSSPAASPTAAPAAGTGGVQDGDLVEIEYTGTLENGSVFDSSKDHGPFQFVIGTGSAIAGFDREVRGMNLGESKKFTLSPEDAYGEYDPALIQSMPIDFIPQGENVTIGDTITLFNGEAYFPATIAAMNATNVTFDLNHQLAGKSLTFDVTLVNLTPASEVEKMMAAYEDETLEMPVMEDEPAAGVLPEENATRTL